MGQAWDILGQGRDKCGNVEYREHALTGIKGIKGINLTVYSVVSLVKKVFPREDAKVQRKAEEFRFRDLSRVSRANLYG